MLGLTRPRRIRVRSGRVFNLAAGCYGYVGSAQRGLAPRLGRHLRRHKISHWHLDFLRAATSIRAVAWAVTTENMECALARRLAASLPVVPGFGATDCACRGHLFYSPRSETLVRAVWHVGAELGLEVKVRPHFRASALPTLKATPSSGPTP